MTKIWKAAESLFSPPMCEPHRPDTTANITGMVTHGCQTAGGEVQPSPARPQHSVGPLPTAQPVAWYLGGCVVAVHEVLRGHSLSGTTCVWPYLNEVGRFLRNRKAFLEPNNGTSPGAVSEQVRQGIFHRPVPAAVSLPASSVQALSTELLAASTARLCGLGLLGAGLQELNKEKLFLFVMDPPASKWQLTSGRKNKTRLCPARKSVLTSVAFPFFLSHSPAPRVLAAALKTWDQISSAGVELLSASIRSISQLGNPAPKPSVLVFPLARTTAGIYWGVCGCTCDVDGALEVYGNNSLCTWSVSSWCFAVPRVLRLGKREDVGASPYLWRLQGSLSCELCLLGWRRSGFKKGDELTVSRMGGEQLYGRRSWQTA